MFAIRGKAVLKNSVRVVYVPGLPTLFMLNKDLTNGLATNLLRYKYNTIIAKFKTTWAAYGTLGQYFTTRNLSFSVHQKMLGTV